MEIQQLPHSIDPARLAREQVNLTGVLALESMQRLANLTEAPGKNALVSLQFGIDEHGLHYFNGHIKAELKLQCQRCLDPLNYAIVVDFMLSPVANDVEAKRLPSYYEPLLMSNRLLDLTLLIEDELILNLPMVAKHEPEQCKIKTDRLQDPIEKTKRNAFSKLAVLKSKLDKR